MIFINVNKTYFKEAITVEERTYIVQKVNKIMPKYTQKIKKTYV